MYIHNWFKQHRPDLLHRIVKVKLSKKRTRIPVGIPFQRDSPDGYNHRFYADSASGDDIEDPYCAVDYGDSSSDDDTEYNYRDASSCINTGSPSMVSNTCAAIMEQVVRNSPVIDNASLNSNVVKQDSSPLQSEQKLRIPTNFSTSNANANSADHGVPTHYPEHTDTYVVEQQIRPGNIPRSPGATPKIQCNSNNNSMYECQNPAALMEKGMDTPSSDVHQSVSQKNGNLQSIVCNEGDSKESSFESGVSHVSSTAGDDWLQLSQSYSDSDIQHLCHSYQHANPSDIPDTVVLGLIEPSAIKKEADTEHIQDHSPTHGQKAITSLTRVLSNRLHDDLAKPVLRTTSTPEKWGVVLKESRLKETPSKCPLSISQNTSCELHRIAEEWNKQHTKSKKRKRDSDEYLRHLSSIQNNLMMSQEVFRQILKDPSPETVQPEKFENSKNVNPTKYVYSFHLKNQPPAGTPIFNHNTGQSLAPKEMCSSSGQLSNVQHTGQTVTGLEHMSAKQSPATNSGSGSGHSQVPFQATLQQVQMVASQVTQQFGTPHKVPVAVVEAQDMAQPPLLSTLPVFTNSPHHRILGHIIHAQKLPHNLAQPQHVFEAQRKQSKGGSLLHSPIPLRLQSYGQNMPQHRQYNNMPQKTASVQQPGQNVPQHGHNKPQHGQSVPQHQQSVPHILNEPQHGQSVPHHGQSMAQKVTSIPQHGHNEPQHGPSVPHGQSVSQHGQSVSQHGQSVPQHGQSVPQPGQNVPQPGQSVPQPGQIVPQPGQSVQQHGQSWPQHGQIVSHQQSLPQHGQSAPQHGQSVPQYGKSVPQYGQTVPQHGQTVPRHAKAESTVLQPTQNLLRPDQSVWQVHSLLRPEEGVSLPSKGILPFSQMALRPDQRRLLPRQLAPMPLPTKNVIKNGQSVLQSSQNMLSLTNALISAHSRQHIQGQSISHSRQHIQGQSISHSGQHIQGQSISNSRQHIQGQSISDSGQHIQGKSTICSEQIGESRQTNTNIGTLKKSSSQNLKMLQESSSEEQNDSSSSGIRNIDINTLQKIQQEIQRGAIQLARMTSFLMKHIQQDSSSVISELDFPNIVDSVTNHCMPTSQNSTLVSSTGDEQSQCQKPETGVISSTSLASSVPGMPRCTDIPYTSTVDGRRIVYLPHVVTPTGLLPLTLANKHSS